MKVQTAINSLNRIFRDERKILASLKDSQSQSQCYNDLSQSEIKEKAIKMVSHQKKLLEAFKVQRVLVAKFKAREQTVKYKLNDKEANRFVKCHEFCS